MTALAAGDPRVLLAAALAYAERGWHVFPLRPGSKQPALHGGDRCPRTGLCRDGHLGWEQRATTDPARIHTCWTHGPAWNLAIACGPSDLVVIDLDAPKGAVLPPPEWVGQGIRDGKGVFAHSQPGRLRARPTDRRWIPGRTTRLCRTLRRGLPGWSGP
jgi:hypothetical protein